MGNTTAGTKQFSISQFANDTAGLLDALNITKGSKFSLVWQETSPDITHITLDGEFVFQSPPGRPLDDIIRNVAEKRLDEDVIHIEQLSSSAK
jgi:hypothetical protein